MTDKLEQSFSLNDQHSLMIGYYSLVGSHESPCVRLQTPYVALDLSPSEVLTVARWIRQEQDTLLRLAREQK